jgi:hypothetical protein
MGASGWPGTLSRENKIQIYFHHVINYYFIFTLRYKYSLC